MKVKQKRRGRIIHYSKLINLDRAKQSNNSGNVAGVAGSERKAMRKKLKEMVIPREKALFRLDERGRRHGEGGEFLHNP